MNNDLTLKEKVSYARSQAALKEAELHFFEAAQPHYPLGFSVRYRNPGHWDISAQQCSGRIEAFLSIEGNRTSARDGGTERAFRIRGEVGSVVVFDARWNPLKEKRVNPPAFKTVMGAMLWIMEELMEEPLPTPPKKED